MLTISLLMLLSGTPAKSKPADAPLPSETVKLFFLAGDLARAQEFARACRRSEPKRCDTLNKRIAEYAFLARDIDALTAEQARELIALDAKITPLARGKITEKVIERYITVPLDRARSRAQGDEKGALLILEKVLIADPKNEGALELQKSLRNRADGGA